MRPDIQETFKGVEWSVLIFFSALCVMIGGLEAVGVLDAIVNLLKGLARTPPVWFAIFLIWIVAGLSANVDNVPITIAFIPVIHGLGEAGMDIILLWWALAFGAGFGGNGTIICSTANITVARLSEKTRTPLTLKIWNRRGLPVMLATCAIASIRFVLLYGLF